MKEIYFSFNKASKKSDLQNREWVRVEEVLDPQLIKWVALCYKGGLLYYIKFGHVRISNPLGR